MPRRSSPRCRPDTTPWPGGTPAPPYRSSAGPLTAGRANRWPRTLYEDWAQETRRALRRAHLQALEEGATAALALRDPMQATALAERAVAREPLREPSALLLARALAASGDQVAALRAIDALRSRLGEEVGLELSAEALALETGLQRGESVEAPRQPLVASARRGAFDGLSFVGRDEELDAVLAAVAGPEPGAAFVVGPAGTGKSRLLAEAAARSDVAGAGGAGVPPGTERAVEPGSGAAAGGAGPRRRRRRRPTRPGGPGARRRPSRTGGATTDRATSRSTRRAAALWPSKRGPG